MFLRTWIGHFNQTCICSCVQVNGEVMKRRGSCARPDKLRDEKETDGHTSTGIKPNANSDGFSNGFWLYWEWEITTGWAWGVGGIQRNQRPEGARGGRRGTVKTVIAFHQLQSIFYTSLKQSNLQVDNYALALFLSSVGRAVPGHDSSGPVCLRLCKLPAIATCSPSRLNWAIN